MVPSAVWPQKLLAQMRPQPAPLVLRLAEDPWPGSAEGNIYYHYFAIAPSVPSWSFASGQMI